MKWATKWKDNLQNWENICKGLISTKCNELVQLNGKVNNPIKNGQRTWINIFPKRTYRCPICTRKGAQHHYSSGKCKSKPRWETTSYLSEWLVSKRQEITNAGEDVEKKQDKTVHSWWEYKLVQPLWKTVWSFFKKLEI